MRLGKYELGRTLGEGNFGKVKFAKDTVSGQPFAVKIIDKSRISHLNFSLQVFHITFSFLLKISFFFPVTSSCLQAERSPEKIVGISYLKDLVNRADKKRDTDAENG